MKITYIYYLEKLKHEILDVMEVDKLENIDPILVTEFKKSIKNITPEYWNKIKDLFVQNIEFTYSYDEQMAFTILASKLGLEFLNKKPEYCGELASILPLVQKSPLNYSNYAKIFLESPIYELIVSIVENNQITSYFELFQIILTRITSANLSEEDRNFILKLLYRFNDQTYTILIEENDTLDEIYYKLYFNMKKANKKGLIYGYDAFRKLAILLNIIDENKENKCKELKEKILEIEKENYTTTSIIHLILKELENFQKIVILTRGKQNGLH